MWVFGPYPCLLIVLKVFVDRYNVFVDRYNVRVDRYEWLLVVMNVCERYEFL